MGPNAPQGTSSLPVGTASRGLTQEKRLTESLRTPTTKTPSVRARLLKELHLGARAPLPPLLRCPGRDYVRPFVVGGRSPSSAARAGEIGSRPGAGRFNNAPTPRPAPSRPGGLPSRARAGGGVPQGPRPRASTLNEWRGKTKKSSRRLPRRGSQTAFWDYCQPRGSEPEVRGVQRYRLWREGPSTGGVREGRRPRGREGPPGPRRVGDEGEQR